MSRPRSGVVYMDRVALRSLTRPQKQQAPRVNQQSVTRQNTRVALSPAPRFGSRIQVCSRYILPCAAIRRDIAVGDVCAVSFHYFVRVCLKFETDALNLPRPCVRNPREMGR